MDINETVDDMYASKASLSNEIKAYLRETAKWAKFISIVGFVFVGLMVLGALSVGIMMGSASSAFAEAGFPFPPALFSLLYLVMAFITAIPVYFLYKFASKMQTALNRNDEGELTESFRYLKSHYKFYGIMMIIILGLYALMLVGAILGASLLG